MRAQSKPKLSQLAADVAVPPRPARIRINALRRTLGAHPGELPFGELTRCGNAAPGSLLQAVLAVEVGPELPVAHRPHGRMAGAQVTTLVQASHLVQKPRSHHGVKALREAFVQHGTISRGERPISQPPAG